MRCSIITCTWNSAAYLAESIASVLAQDTRDIEYIFVDGGSTDGTLEIIKGIRDRKITLIENIRGGISRAMNAGIEAASGDVIAHLHSDDYYAHSHVLSRVVTTLETSGAQWCFGRCLSDINGARVPESYIVPRYSYRRLLKGNFIPHPATFVARALFAQVGRFDEGAKYAMDYDLWLRLGGIAEPIQLDEHLAVFRRHQGSQSTANPLASLREDFSIRMRYAPRDPWSRAYHWAHYWVRQARIRRALVSESVT